MTLNIRHRTNNAVRCRPAEELASLLDLSLIQEIKRNSQHSISKRVCEETWNRKVIMRAITSTLVRINDTR